MGQQCCQPQTHVESDINVHTLELRKTQVDQLLFDFQETFQNNWQVLWRQYSVQLKELQQLREHVECSLDAKQDPLHVYKRTLKNYIVIQSTDPEMFLPRNKMYVIIEIKVLLKQLLYPHELFQPIYNMLAKEPESIEYLIDENTSHCYFEKFEKIGKLSNEIIAFFAKELQQKPTITNNTYCNRQMALVVQTLRDVQEYYNERRKQLLHELLATDPHKLSRAASRIAQDGICEMRAPFLGSLLVKPETMRNLLYREGQSQETLQQLELECRIKLQILSSEESSLSLQRNLLIYVFNQFLFQSEINPMLVGRATFISGIGGISSGGSSNKNNRRSISNIDHISRPVQKKKIYFMLVSLPNLSKQQHSILQFQPRTYKSSRRIIVLPQQELQEGNMSPPAQQDQKRLHSSTSLKRNPTQPLLQINNRNFLNHLLSFLSTSFLEQHYIPYYYIEEVEDTDASKTQKAKQKPAKIQRAQTQQQSQQQQLPQQGITMQQNTYEEKTQDQSIQQRQGLIRRDFSKINPNKSSQSNEGKEEEDRFAALKCPLLLFKEMIMEASFNEEELGTLLFRREVNYLNQFLEAVNCLYLAGITDFKDAWGCASLYMSPQQLDAMRTLMQRFSEVSTQLFEAVFPCQNRVFLMQILNYTFPIYTEFVQLVMDDKNIHPHVQQQHKEPVSCTSNKTLTMERGNGGLRERSRIGDYLYIHASLRVLHQFENMVRQFSLKRLRQSVIKDDWRGSTSLLRWFSQPIQQDCITPKMRERWQSFFCIKKKIGLVDCDGSDNEDDEYNNMVDIDNGQCNDKNDMLQHLVNQETDSINQLLKKDTSQPQQQQSDNKQGQSHDKGKNTNDQKNTALGTMKPFQFKSLEFKYVKGCESFWQNLVNIGCNKKVKDHIQSQGNFGDQVMEAKHSSVVNRYIVEASAIFFGNFILPYDLWTQFLSVFQQQHISTQTATTNQMPREGTFFALKPYKEFVGYNGGGNSSGNGSFQNWVKNTSDKTGIVGNGLNYYFQIQQTARNNLKIVGQQSNGNKFQESQMNESEIQKCYYLQRLLQLRHSLNHSERLRRCACVQYEGQRIMVEQNPTFGGQQLCLDLFNAALLPSPLNLGERVLAQISNEMFLFHYHHERSSVLTSTSTISTGGKGNYPGDFTQPITLKEYLTINNNILDYQLFDEILLSERILSTMLLFPSADGPEDELVSTITFANQQSYYLTFIGDAEACLLSNSRGGCFEGPNASSINCMYSLGVKSVLFCSDFMNHVIPLSVYDKYSDFMGITTNLLNWMQQAIQLQSELSSFCKQRSHNSQEKPEKGKKHKSVASQIKIQVIDTLGGCTVGSNSNNIGGSSGGSPMPTFPNVFFNNSSDKTHQDIRSSVLFCSKAGRRLAERYCRMHLFLSQSRQSRRGYATHQELLEYVDPFLGRIYAKINRLTETRLQERYLMVQEDLRGLEGYFQITSIPNLYGFFEGCSMGSSLIMGKDLVVAEQNSDQVYEAVRLSQGASLAGAFAQEIRGSFSEGALATSIYSSTQIGPSKFRRQMKKAFTMYQDLVLKMYILNKKVEPLDTSDADNDAVRQIFLESLTSYNGQLTFYNPTNVQEIKTLKFLMAFIDYKFLSPCMQRQIYKDILQMAAVLSDSSSFPFNHDYTDQQQQELNKPVAILADGELKTLQEKNSEASSFQSESHHPIVSFEQEEPKPVLIDSALLSGRSNFSPRSNKNKNSRTYSTDPNSITIANYSLVNISSLPVLQFVNVSLLAGLDLEKCVRVWPEFMFLRSLSLIKCALQERDLLVISQNCKCLTTLNLSGVTSLTQIANICGGVSNSCTAVAGSNSNFQLPQQQQQFLGRNQRRSSSIVIETSNNLVNGGTGMLGNNNLCGQNTANTLLKTHQSFTNIPEVDQASVYMKFPTLRTLVLAGMTRLNTVNINAPKLLSIDLEDCIVLQQVNCKTRLLKRVNAINCQQLKSEIISLWIIKGLDVAFNQYTAGCFFADSFCSNRLHQKKQCKQPGFLQDPQRSNSISNNQPHHQQSSLLTNQPQPMQQIVVLQQKEQPLANHGSQISESQAAVKQSQQSLWSSQLLTQQFNIYQEQIQNGQQSETPSGLHQDALASGAVVGGNGAKGAGSIGKGVGELIGHPPITNFQSTYEDQVLLLFSQLYCECEPRLQTLSESIDCQRMSQDKIFARRSFERGQSQISLYLQKEVVLMEEIGVFTSGNIQTLQLQQAGVSFNQNNLRCLSANLNTPEQQQQSGLSYLNEFPEFSSNKQLIKGSQTQQQQPISQPQLQTLQQQQQQPQPQQQQSLANSQLGKPNYSSQRKQMHRHTTILPHLQQQHSQQKLHTLSLQQQIEQQTCFQSRIVLLRCLLQNRFVKNIRICMIYAYYNYLLQSTINQPGVNQGQQQPDFIHDFLQCLLEVLERYETLRIDSLESIDLRSPHSKVRSRDGDDEDIDDNDNGEDLVQLLQQQKQYKSDRISNSNSPFQFLQIPPLSKESFQIVIQIAALLRNKVGLSLFLQQQTDSTALQLLSGSADLRQLTYLNLSSVRVAGATAHTLGLFLASQNARNCSYLALSHCHIDNDAIIALSQGLSKNRSLKSLDLSNNVFNHVGINKFVAVCCFSQPVSSSLIDVAEQRPSKNNNSNNDKNPNGNHIVSSKDKLSKGNELQLPHLQQPQLQHQSPQLQQQPLHTLILSRNNLYKLGFEALSNIIHLHIREAQLVESDILALSEFLKSGDRCRLQTLDLSRNELSLNCLLALTEGLAQNSSVQHLILQQTFQIDVQKYKKLEVINRYLRSLRIKGAHLKSLDISYNSISDDGLIGLSFALKDNRSLRKLVIRDTYFNCRSQGEAKTIQGLQCLSNMGVENAQLDTHGATNSSRLLCEFCENIAPDTNLLDIELRGFSRLEVQSCIQSAIKKGNYRIQHIQQNLRRGGDRTNDYCLLGLAIDGRGTRSLIPAAAIEIISQQSKCSAHQIFDVIGGQSFGGILAMACVASHDGGLTAAMDSADLAQFILNISPRIFNSSSIQNRHKHSSSVLVDSVIEAYYGQQQTQQQHGDLCNSCNVGINEKRGFGVLLDHSKYDNCELDTLLQVYFKDSLLSQTVLGTSAIVTAAEHSLFNKSIFGGGSLERLQVFRSREATYSEESDFFIREVALASASTPMYFPPAAVRGRGSHEHELLYLTDASVYYQQNIAQYVLSDIKEEAMCCGRESNYFVISLGSATHYDQQKQFNVYNSTDTHENYGAFFGELLDQTLLEAHEDRFLRVKPYIQLEERQAILDLHDNSVLDQYYQLAQEEIQKLFLYQYKYGQFRDRCLLDWISENTAKKRDYFI